MALDPANYIDELSITDPTATDLVSQGDDQIRTVKRAVKQSFPSVDIAVNAIHTSATEPSVSVAEGLVWIDTSGGAGNHVAKIYDGSAFIVLPFSVEAAKTVDVDGGTIDGAVIGGATPAAISGTTLDASTSLVLATGATVTGIDNATLATGSATLLATQGAIKTYVDAQVTDQDLDITTDSGSIDIDLDSESLTISGGEGIDTSATGTTVTIAAEEATTSNKGVASFDTAKFTVSSGAVTTKDSAIIGSASLEDLSNVSSVSPTNDYVLKYSSTSSEWQPAAFAYPDKLTTKGDLLAYNTVDAETRFAVGTNDYVLMADSSATNGFNWKQAATATIADDAITADKLADTAVTPGSYTVASITGDQQGRLTSASSGTVSGFVSETGATGSAELPAGTTVQRDGSPSAGYMRFNSTTTGFEGYNGSAWGSLGGGAKGGGSDEIFYENGQSVTSDYTITSNMNAVSAGPVTVDSGVTVTINSPSEWVIV